jgi:hypothetical protein
VRQRRSRRRILQRGIGSGSISVCNQVKVIAGLSGRVGQSHIGPSPPAGILKLACQLARRPARALPVMACQPSKGPSPAMSPTRPSRQLQSCIGCLERDHGCRRGPWEGAIRGRIVAGVPWLGRIVKTRFTLFDARRRRCARALAACGGGRVPLEFAHQNSGKLCR